MELVAGIVLALAALALVLEPLFRASVAGSPPPPVVEDAAEDDTGEAETPKVKALLALREIEFDLATGKLSEEDYLALKSQYSRRALAAIEAEDEGPAAARGSELDPAEAAVRRAREKLDTVVCPECGPRPERGAKFCSRCGLGLLQAAGSTCAACGSALESGSKFCSKCGSPAGSSRGLKPALGRATAP